VTSEYGIREHPIFGGQRFHTGIDIAIDGSSDPNVRTIAGGQVLFTGWISGWGNSVAVRTPDGFIEQYNHLDSYGVAEGEVIQPGTSVGGQGYTGNATGPHIDFVVWKPETTDEQFGYDAVNWTMNPREYMAMTHSIQEAPRNTGVAASPVTLSSIPADANTQELVEIFRSNWDRHVAQGVQTSNGFVESSSTAYTTASPQRPSRASIFRSSYINRGNVQVHNDPANNYGYAALANNREYRIALARTASRLNIPAMWLADVIDLETAGTHSPRAQNGISFAGTGLPCTGLIQWCDHAGMQDLADWNGLSLGAMHGRLLASTHEQQLEYVYQWLARYSNNGKDLETIEDLYALINGGQEALALSSARRQGVADRNNNLPGHFATLGNRAGRRYQTSYDRLQGGAGNIHYVRIQGCSECERHLNLWNKVEPHYEP